MGSFNRDDRSAGGFRGGFSRGGSRGGDRGRSSFGAPRSFERGGDRGNRPMFTATCSNCGKECQVPFRPTNGKPVYCSDCFEKMGNRGDSRRPERSDFRPQAPSFDQNKSQFDALNAKMDRILNLLQPKAEAPVAVVPAVKVDMKEVMKEIKLPEVKKATKKVSSKK
ncbi:MAG TPA: CxxC-x17-CxxC domain-containing protein [Patescibacteria group bacterium]|nr:CxxC-x17-CxxC domain-containing protein [Patescibacteria group bacterium]